MLYFGEVFNNRITVMDRITVMENNSLDRITVMEKLLRGSVLCLVAVLSQLANKFWKLSSCSSEPVMEKFWRSYGEVMEKLLSKHIYTLSADRDINKYSELPAVSTVQRTLLHLENTSVVSLTGVQNSVAPRVESSVANWVDIPTEALQWLSTEGRREKNFSCKLGGAQEQSHRGFAIVVVVVVVVERELHGNSESVAFPPRGKEFQLQLDGGVQSNRWLQWPWLLDALCNINMAPWGHGEVQSQKWWRSPTESLRWLFESGRPLDSAVTLTRGEELKDSPTKDNVYGVYNVYDDAEDIKVYGVYKV